MRKVVLNLAVSLDGFIEGPNGEFDWCFTDQDYGMKDFLKRTDAIFIGRKSYELLTEMEGNPYPKKKIYVFSSTLKREEKNVIFIDRNIEEKVNSIKKETGKDIWLFGGAELAVSLINLKLVDELQLSVHPLLLGKGKPLFKDLKERMKLNLINTRTYSSGLVQLLYQIK